MKKYLLLATALLIGGTAMAQQALWGRASVKSPEINPDRTVTFRIAAPKASRWR